MIYKQDFDGVADFVYFRDVRENLMSFAEGRNELIKADTTHWEPYDKHFKWLRGEITGFGGIPNHGKSKFVVFLTALKMYYHNWKVAIYSPESAPPEFFFANYIHTLSGHSLFSKIQRPTKEEINTCGDLLENHLFLCEPEKSPTAQGVFHSFQKAFDHHGCDMFVIDPFNCLDREWEKQKRDDHYVGEFLENFRRFSLKNNACGIVVMHPNASVRQGKTSYDLECPSTYNLAGGAMWHNKLDNLIFVHRPYFFADYSNSTVLIRHAKIKKREIVGSGGDTIVNFNFVTNRYNLENVEPSFKQENREASLTEVLFEEYSAPF